MESQLAKNERIELRVTPTEKKIFKKAQRLSGDKSFNSFIVRILKKQADEIISKNDKIIHTERDRQVFFDAVFDNEKPNQDLLEAAERYRSRNS